MNCFFCHICNKEFYLQASQVKELESQKKDVQCSHCQSEFVEEIELSQPKVNDTDSQGNEFLSCKSDEQGIPSSLIDSAYDQFLKEQEENAQTEEDWEDLEREERRRQRRNKNQNS